MKKFIVLILALNMYLGVFAQFTPGDTLKYRISLKDKAATDYSLQKPEKYLSKKSIERRKKQGLPIDSTDLPVCKEICRCHTENRCPCTCDRKMG